jgi:hypothetical protein
MIPKRESHQKGFERLSIIALFALLVISPVALAQQPTHQARAVQPVGLEGDLIDIMRANDGQLNTRATSGRPRYSGMNIVLDVGGLQNIVGVHQDHGRWPTHYAGAYRVEVGESANGPWLRTFEGPGNRGDSRAIFEAVRGRFVRVTATANNGGGPDWSIAEIKAIIDPGATSPRRIPVGGVTPPVTRPSGSGRIWGDLQDLELALDRAPSTRATTGRANYTGASFTLDLGGEYQLSRVVQQHGRWSDEYPGEYKIEVSRRRDEADFREVWRGRGEPGRSTATFDSVNTRYVRVTALRNRDRTNWWSIAELRTNRDPDVIEDEETRRIDRDIRRATAQGFADINAAIDESNVTRATTSRANYTGNWILLDLGGSYTVSRVMQIHDPNDREFPARYKVETSEDGARWQTVWEGQGETGRSRANFNPVRARYIRITATDDRNGRQPWSVSSIRVSG